LGFSVFVSVILAEQFGAPLLKSAAILVGLAVGCAFSAGLGYWSSENIQAAPTVTFLWTYTFNLSVDGALVLPLLLVFICEGVSYLPDSLATAEISGVEIEGTNFNSRIQGRNPLRWPWQSDLCARDRCPWSARPATME
jgi:xanthine/uracil permease